MLACSLVRITTWLGLWTGCCMVWASREADSHLFDAHPHQAGCPSACAQMQPACGPVGCHAGPAPASPSKTGHLQGQLQSYGAQPWRLCCRPNGDPVRACALPAAKLSSSTRSRGLVSRRGSPWRKCRNVAVQASIMLSQAWLHSLSVHSTACQAGSGLVSAARIVVSAQGSHTWRSAPCGKSSYCLCSLQLQQADQRGIGRVVGVDGCTLQPLLERQHRHLNTRLRSA